MNPFTGGCHYDEGCGRFASGCGMCPQLGSARLSDFSRRIFLRKQKALNCIGVHRLHIVAQSRWIAGEAARSPLLGRFPITVIPNGVDTNAFRPRNRAFSRDVLGIPHTSKAILFVAESTRNRRKGLDLFTKALRSLPDVSSVTVLIAGHSKPEDLTGLDCRLMGLQGNDRLLSLLYSAADVFVIPSRQDNLPNTVLESMACGTPVVGFNVGGIPDMVRPGSTGWLAEPGDADSLSAVITRSLSNTAEREAFSSRARSVVEEEYTLELQVRRYRELYESAIQSALRTEPSA
jgi:glycosyltransferase involved in cell wall biosynthesis